MSNVKTRFRMARSLEEAAKLIYSPAKGGTKGLLKNYRGAQKFWEAGVYENLQNKDAHPRSDFYARKKQKTITLPKLKFMEIKDKNDD